MLRSDRTITLETHRRDLSQLQQTTNLPSLCQRRSCPQVSYRRRTETMTSRMADCRKHTCQTPPARSNSTCFPLSHDFQRRSSLLPTILAIPSAHRPRPSIRTIAGSSLHPFCLLKVRRYSAIMPTGTPLPEKRVLRVSKGKSGRSLCPRSQLATASPQTNPSYRQRQVGGSPGRHLRLTSSRPTYYRAILRQDRLRRRDSQTVSYLL